MSLLTAQSLSRRFGGLQALRNVSFSVETRGIVGIIGPNGAGKTTLFNVLAGMLLPDEGSIAIDGLDCTGLPTHRMADAGLVKTSQIVQVFDTMSVEENVLVGALFREGTLDSAWDRARSELEFLHLSPMAKVPARDLTLSGRARVELARALALGPRILLIDELMAGLNSVEVSEMLKLLNDIAADRGVLLIVIEHNMTAIMRLCERILVMADGELIADGTPQQVSRDPQVIKTYLGEDV